MASKKGENILVLDKVKVTATDFFQVNHNMRDNSRSGAFASTEKKRTGKALVRTLRKENGQARRALSTSMVNLSRDRRFRRKPDVMVS